MPTPSGLGRRLVDGTRCNSTMVLTGADVMYVPSLMRNFGFTSVPINCCMVGDSRGHGGWRWPRVAATPSRRPTMRAYVLLTFATVAPIDKLLPYPSYHIGRSVCPSHVVIFPLNQTPLGHAGLVRVRVFACHSRQLVVQFQCVRERLGEDCLRLSVRQPLAV